MHHYPFHIGDYRKDTTNLSLLEHGVYRALIDCYYLQETPLFTDKARLCRLIGARTADEREAVSNIMDDFFILKSDGYYHDGCDKVLSVIYDKSEKARDSVEKRWAKHRETIRTQCERNTNVCETDTNVSKTDTDCILPNTQYPIPITQNKTLTSSDDDKPVKIDYQAIIDLYNKSLPELPAVKILTDKRRTAIRSCCLVKQRFSETGFWEVYFQEVRKSDFLMGRKTDWKADFDFLITRNKFVKVVEGAY